jgi:hypothetical protein
MEGVCSIYGRHKKNAYNILGGKLEGRDHSEDMGVDERMILEWIFGK